VPIWSGHQCATQHVTSASSGRQPTSNVIGRLLLTGGFLQPVQTAGLPTFHCAVLGCSLASLFGMSEHPADVVAVSNSELAKYKYEYLQNTRRIHQW